MENITKEQVQKAIHDFLQNQYHEKTEKEQKQLAKAQEDADYEKVAQLNEKLAKAKEKYSFEVWIDDAANRMAKQLNFGTHISKGIHSSSRGDNINFQTSRKLPKSIVGHQCLKEVSLDATGNAAALPLASFLEHPLNIENPSIKIKDVFIDHEDVIKDCLSRNKPLSESYFYSIRNCLLGIKDEIYNSEYNKQMLWPLSFDADRYVLITPLYPTSITFYLYETLNYSKFSKKEKIKDISAYKTFNNLAVLHIGGSNPQGVSSLASKQRGRNYLLPSLPPQFKQNQSFKIQPYADSLFSKGLEYRCRDIFAALVRLIKTNYNNVNIRNSRKDILDSLLYKVLAIASNIQEEYPAGWSKDYSLHMNEKFWLDPQRAEQDEQFAEQRQNQEWQQDISNRFANWLNAQLKQQFKKIKHEFADAEHMEWQQEMQEMINETQRQGMEVFQ